MPHVVIEGDVDLPAWARDFAPRTLRSGSDLYKIERLYLDTGGRSALVEVLAIEAGRKLPFYVRISSHERGSTTVRIDPLTHPDRSEGVKQLVAEIAAELLRRTRGARVGVTNLVLPSLE